MRSDRSPGGSGTDPLKIMRFLIHLPNFIKLYWRLFTDRRVSVLPKAILVLGLVYLLVPTDALFDFMIPLGLLDDAAVLILTAKAFMALCDPGIVEEHVQLIDEGG